MTARIYVPGDSGALALGADAVAEAIARGGGTPALCEEIEQIATACHDIARRQAALIANYQRQQPEAQVVTAPEMVSNVTSLRDLNSLAASLFASDNPPSPVV